MIKNLTTTPFILIGILTISFTAPAQTIKTDEPKVVLESFNKPGLILLVETTHKGMYKNYENNHLLKACNKYYMGKSELAYRNEVDEKFRDKEIYRYYLMEEVIGTSFNSKAETQLIIGYFLLDRKTDKKMNLDVKSTYNRMGAFKLALKKLDSYLTIK